jgi:ABC-type sugar transport system ATPase subunit
VTLLAVQDVAKSFPGVRALDGVSLDVAAGEVHALVGENGAGKSTLIRVVGGAYVPDAGRVLLDGRPLPSGDPLATRRRGVSIIYQELTLVPELTAAENVFLGDERRPAWLDRRSMEAETQRLLDGLGAGFPAASKVAGLSVAQRQTVEIARALRGASRVLVLDEPTSSLPEPDARRLLEVVRGLRGRGLAIVYISHRLEEIFAVADRVTVLRDGRVTGSARVADIDRRQLVRWMVGRDLSEEFPARGTPTGEPVLDVADLSVPGRVHGVSLAVRRGEILGLAGLVGSGRTSTGLALAGALRSRGTIRLDGRPVRFASPSDALAAGVAYLTEDRKAAGLFPWLGVGHNLTIASLRRFGRLGFLDRRRERDAARRATTDFDVRCAGLEQRAATLSGGNQQKMLLARFLLEPRRVLVLDEPTRGVDVGSKAEIYALMDRLTQSGLAILLISSDLPELLGMADRVVVLCEGRTTGVLERAEATEERVMTLATPGAAA